MEGVAGAMEDRRSRSLVVTGEGKEGEVLTVC